MNPHEQLADAQRRYLPPPELDGSRPREVVLTAGGKALAAVAVLLFTGAVAVGIGMQGEVLHQADVRRAFALNGVETKAVVTRLWRASGDSKQPWVAYEFAAAGQVFDGRSKMRLSHWKELQVGSELAVRYVGTNPSQSRLTGAEPGGLPAWLPVVLTVSIASGGLLCLFFLNRQRRLLAEGRVSPAVVTELAKHHTSHGGSYGTVKYAFPLLSGAVANGKSDTTRKPPAVGSVIWVIYDPERPTRSMLYPFPLVRPSRSARRPA